MNKLNDNIALNSEKKQKLYFIRFKNIPTSFEIVDLKCLFYQYNVKEEDLVLSFDIFGRKTGEVCLKLYTESDFREILSTFKLYDLLILVNI